MGVSSSCGEICACGPDDIDSWMGCGQCSPAQILNPSDSEESSVTGVMIGILLFNIGTVLYAAGPHVKNFADRRKKRVIGYLGLIGYSLAGLFWSIATQFASLSLLGPFLALAVPGGFFFGWLLNQDEITCPDIVGGSLIVFAVVLMALGMPLDVLTPVISSPSTNSTMCLQAACWVSSVYVYTPNFLTSMCLICVAGIIGGSVIFATRSYSHAKEKTVHDEALDAYRVSFGVVAGLGGGVGTVIAQPMFYFILPTIGCPGILFSSPIPYCCVAFLLVATCVQLKSISTGMQVATAKLIVTMEITANFLSTTLGGLLGAQTYRGVGESGAMKGHPTIAWVLISTGFVTSAVGAAILTNGNSARRTKESMRLGKHGTIKDFQVDGVDVDYAEFRRGSPTDSDEDKEEEISEETSGSDESESSDSRGRKS